MAMKPHWSESAIWQFIGVVLSALGLIISFLPENQRLLGAIIAIVGTTLFSLVLIRKPAKRITQQLTRRRIPNASQSPSYLVHETRIRKPSIVREERDKDETDRTYPVIIKVIYAIIVTLAILAFTAWEVSLVSSYIENIFPNHSLLFMSESSQYTKLWEAYNKLYQYAEISLFILGALLLLVNVYIAAYLTEVLMRAIKYVLKGNWNN